MAIHPVPSQLLDSKSRSKKLRSILEAASNSSSGCFFHSQDSAQKQQPESTLSYAELLSLAKTKAAQVAALAETHQTTTGRSPIVLLYFDSIESNIVWFWATIISGLSPAVATPLPASAEQRARHLAHLATLLESPIVLTSDALASDVNNTEGFHVATVEKLPEARQNYRLPSDVDPPVYMLTSGSSGNAKAVELQSQQIFASMNGKKRGLGSASSNIFLNWIGFDHVANLTECHLHAMYLGANQHHVPAADVISEPLVFLELLHHYKITSTFAPNFFLARLCDYIQANAQDIPSDVDLQSLRRINSGGEANLVETATRLDAALQKLGAKSDLVVPGFGMSETCAGSIYSAKRLQYDVSHNREFTSLGKPVPGLSMRIAKEDNTSAVANELGVLQISGPIVFSKYLNNPKATSEAFTEDGWFSTGDKAFLDGNGFLYLSGRDKDIINIDGQKYAPHELETSVEEGVPGDIVPSHTMVFSTRPRNGQREEICVIYNPSFPLDDIEKRLATSGAITQIVGIRASARPKHIIALPKNLLPKSSLGKLPRAKLRTAFEEGKYREYEDRYNDAMKARRDELSESPSSTTEKIILQQVKSMSIDAFEEGTVGVNASIFDLGITSTDLFILSGGLQDKLNIKEKIPVGTFFTDPTIKGIASAIDQLGNDEYIPVVPLQRDGDKTPLFLVHPGSGDVLIFVGLSKYFTDRPVYGIRTRCLYEGEDYHETIHSMAQCYYEHIKKIQPEGPYAVAGYSLGSSVAYEIGKLLEADGSSVPFLGILDSPPHIKHLIGTQDFIDVLLNVSYFLELITEDYAMVESIPMHGCSNSEALDLILEHAPPKRLKNLSIDKARLEKITWVTKSFGTAGRDYDPSGSVANIDVFWVHPLLWVAPNREEWMDKHLRHWVNYCREAPQYHELRGSHSQMLNASQLDGTAKRIRSTLRARGL